MALGWNQQWTVGVYLSAGGAVIFLVGIGLSIYREKLLQLPDQIATRNGIFRVFGWR